MDDKITIRDLERRDIEPVADLFVEDMRTLGLETPRSGILGVLEHVLEDQRSTAATWVA